MDQRLTITGDRSHVCTSQWEFCSAAELLGALRSKKLSALELLQHTISRIEALDRHLNAIVMRDFDRAIDAAKAADAALARDEYRPLLGIPVTVKEAFDVAGLQTTWGLPQFRGLKPVEDSIVVSRLKEAGAVIIGKTNVSEGLRDFQCYNDVYGTTNNPWDLTRTPGGSSGGSAASVAAGFEAFSIGSDIGGSIRMPAHFCGIYGHKPTLGLVPLRGYNRPPVPALPGLDDLVVAGPMARHASDLELALGVLAGPDEANEGIGYSLALPPSRHRLLGDFRVSVVDTHPLVPVTASVRSAIERLAIWLERAGAKVTWTSSSMPDLGSSSRLYMKLLGSAKSQSTCRREFKHLMRTLAIDDHSLQAERARGTVISHRDWLCVNTARRRLQQRWHTFFGEFDVLICPAAAVPAFPHDHFEPIEDRRLNIDGEPYPYDDACYIWADPASTCGLPATVAPIGRSSSGLPIGVQIIGPYLEDHTPIGFAKLLERELYGFVPPDFEGSPEGIKCPFGRSGQAIIACDWRA